MRLVLVATVLLAASVSSADPVTPIRPSLGCEVVADRAAVALGTAHATDVLALHCEADRWPGEARACFLGAGASARCLELLSHDQRRALSGEPRLANRVQERPVVMTVSYTPSRALHDQGIAAYQRGQYPLAVKKLTAAYETRPSPELVYHLAQAYRREGQWSTAVDLYEKYLEIAPAGPAANDCRVQLEQLGAQL